MPFRTMDVLPKAVQNKKTLPESSSHSPKCHKLEAYQQKAYTHESYTHEMTTQEDAVMTTPYHDNPVS